MNNTFIADVHLGKLARELRLLGFDTLYSNKATPAELVAFAKEQHRTLLSRYAGFATQLPQQMLLVRSVHPAEQLQQVIEHVNLKDAIQPFTRCLVCNGELMLVPKAKIREQLEPRTRDAFNEFWQCGSCERIYWKGSHYERMIQLVEKVKALPFLLLKERSAD